MINVMASASRKNPINSNTMQTTRTKTAAESMFVTSMLDTSWGIRSKVIALPKIFAPARMSNRVTVVRMDSTTASLICTHVMERSMKTVSTSDREKPIPAASVGVNTPM